MQKEVAPQPEPVKIRHSIALRDEAMHVFSTLSKLLHPAQRSGASDDHKTKFKRLDEAYTDYVRKNAQPCSFPENTLEASEGFYYTKLPNMFDHFYSTH